jgi:hypothetical protein
MPYTPPEQNHVSQPTSQPVITINPEIAERISPSSRPRSSQPVSEPRPQYTPPPPRPEPAPAYQAEAPAENIDWIAVGLGLLAVLAVGGLIPFWLMVILSWFPPNR